MLKPSQPAVGDVEILDAAGKADLAAQRLELAAQGSDHEREPVRAQVRAVLVDDRGPAVALGEDFQHVGDIGARAAGGELAVAEGAGTPLAEEVIAFGIERTVLIESAYVGDAFLDGAAALEDQRLIPAPRQQVAGEQAGRPGADDHRADGAAALLRARASGSDREYTARPPAHGLLQTRARSLSERSTAAE